MSPNDMAARALGSGENTSEHAVMVQSGKFGNVLLILGTLGAALPQILQFLSMAPEGLLNSTWGATIIAVLGGLVALIGAMKKMLTEISYIQGRSLVKAAAVRDISPTVPVPAATPVVNDNTGA